MTHEVGASLKTPVPSPYRGDAYMDVGSRATQEQLAEGEGDQ